MVLTPAQYQAARRQRRQLEIDAMPQIPCICGCDSLIPPINKQGKPARYAHGHNPTPPPPPMGGWNKGKPAPWAGGSHKGKILPPEQIARRTATRIAKNGGKYTSEESQKAGILKRPASWRPNVIAAIRNRDLSGPNNPAWEGGISILPYGPEFTRRFKRLIRERDGNKCQHCGKTAKEERKVSHKTLSVHHIDHDKTNNDPNNVITTCNFCNVYFGHHRAESLLAFPRRKMLLT